MRRIMLGIIVCSVFSAGCGFRFAPTEQQKQNAWLHNRTAMMVADVAKHEEGSDKLQALTKLSELQSRAVASYYGLPGEFPNSFTADDILSESNFQLARMAIDESGKRPDAWQVADSVLELGIGICALFGGVYCTKLVSFLRQARGKSDALKEIIKGNELFKKQNAQTAEAFKQAHSSQSSQTRKIVAELKS